MQLKYWSKIKLNTALITDFGPIQTNPLNDLHVIVIDDIYLIVHIVRIVLS